MCCGPCNDKYGKVNTLRGKIEGWYIKGFGIFRIVSWVWDFETLVAFHG